MDVLEHVSQRRVHVSIDRLPQLGHEPVIALVILGAQIIRFGIESLPSKCETSVEEVRFGQGKNKIFSLRAVLDSQPEFLSSPGKRWPVEKIEIALCQSRESHQLIHCAEAAAEAERAGPFFLHQNVQIFAARYVRVFRISLDLCKVTQVF